MQEISIIFSSEEWDEISKRKIGSKNKRQKLSQYFTDFLSLKLRKTLSFNCWLKCK